MIRTLLATTAMAAALSVGAFAQDAATPAPVDKPAQPAMTTAPDAAAARNVATIPQFVFASDILGKTIYNSQAEDAVSIGDVNDVVFATDGSAEMVIVGVGGFLGIGEKNVAVPYEELTFMQRGNAPLIVLETTKENLESAPAFDRAAYTDGMTTDMAETDKPAANTTETMAPADTAEAPAGTVAPDATTPADTAQAEPVTTPDANAKVPANDTAAQTPAAGAEGTDTMQTAAIDRSTLTAVMQADLTADTILGTTVYGANDEAIGEVSDILMNAENGVDGFVLDVGGFLGMGEKPVAVAAENLEIMADANGGLTIFTPFTEEQLKAQAEYNPDAYKTDRDSIIMMAPAG